MKQHKDERVPHPNDSLMLPRPSRTRGTALWAEIPAGELGQGVLPLCPRVQLSWVSGRLSRELSERPFPLAPDRAAGSVPRGAPPDAPLHPSRLERPCDGSQPEFPCTSGPWEGRARWLTVRRCPHTEWVCGGAGRPLTLTLSWRAGRPHVPPRPQKGQAGTSLPSQPAAAPRVQNKGACVSPPSARRPRGTT